MQSGDEGQRDWDKEHEPKRFITYTLKQAYKLMDEVYDVATKHKINLTEYIRAALPEVELREEEENA